MFGTTWRAQMEERMIHHRVVSTWYADSFVLKATPTTPVSQEHFAERMAENCGFPRREKSW